MVHSIEVQLMADIEKYRQGMEAAKKIGSDAMGFISSVFDTIKRLASGMWDSLKSVFSGIGSSTKGAFDSISDSASSAFQKIGALLPGFHAGLDKTQQKLSETEDKADGLITKIGVGIVASVAAATAALALLVKKGLDADTALAGVSISGNLAASQISRFEATAMRSNVSAQEFAGSMIKLREEMTKAAAGSGGDAFEKMGVKIVDANNALLKTDDVTIEVAKKIAAMSTEAEKYAAASKVGFEGKVQVLEDIARASDLSATTTDEQAAAVVRLGKIWHDILPGGKSMWAEVGTFLTTNLTPAMTEASIGILSAKNKILDAFHQIFGTGSMVTALGDKIKDWGSVASKWISGVADGVANLEIKLMRFAAAKTGLGNADAPLASNPVAIPAAVPLASTASTPIVKDEDKKQLEAYEAMTKVIKEKTEAQRLEIQTAETLTDGQRLAIKFTTDLRDGILTLTDAQKIQRAADLTTLISQEKANAAATEARKDAASATEKEGAAYASVIASIKARTAAGQLELAAGAAATDSEKENIKVEEALASGKLKLTAAHLAAVRAALAEQAATESLLKLQTAQKDVTKFIVASTAARNDASAALEVEYATYGKTADAREIAMVALKAEASAQKVLDDLREKKLPITDQIVAQLKAETDARTLVEQATLAQSKALGYAAQLADDNKRFAAESIFDERDRATALLAIDEKMWQDRIALAGAGTDAQKKLQEEYDAWYKNQLIKPTLDAQKQLWSSIDTTAHDTFISIFNSGKSAFDRLRDALKNGLLDLLYQMTVKKWIMNIGASVSANVANAAGAAGAAGNLLNGANGSGNLLSTAGGVASLVSAATGSSISSIGTMLGSSTIAEFGSGVSGSAAAAAQALGAEMTTAASAGSALASAFATAVPWIAAAGVAFAAWNAFFEDGPESNTRLTFTNNNAPGNISINDRGNQGQYGTSYVGNNGTSSLGTFGVQSTFWMNADQDVVQSFIKTVSQTDDALSAFMTTAEKASVSSYLTGKTYDAATGAEGSNPNASGQLDAVFRARINNILDGLEPGLSALESGFTGTSQELATEVASLLQYRAALHDGSQAVFGATVTLQQLAALKQPTEATSAALTRITNEFTTTNSVAALFGKSAEDVFGAVGLASVGARENLVTLSGGLDALASQTNAFAQNFLTEGERLAPIAQAVDDALSSLGYTGIETRDQFKQLAQSIIDSGALATEAGAKQYANLMAIAQDFATAHPEDDDLVKQKRQLEIQIMDLQGDHIGALAAKRAQEVAEVDKSLQALQSMADALQDLSDAQSAYDSAVSNARSALSAAADQYQAFVDAVSTSQKNLADAQKAISDAYDKAMSADVAAKSAVQAEQDKITAGYIAATDKVTAAQAQIADGFYKLGQTINDFLGTLDTSDLGGASKDSQLASLQASLAINAAQAKAGNTDAGGKLTGIANSILTVGKDTTATQADYMRLVASVRATLSSVAASATRQGAGSAAASPTADLDAAIAEQKRWADAVTASGSALTASSTNLLDGYNKAVQAQQQSDAELKYWAQVMAATGTDFSATKNALQVTGDGLIKGFFDAQQALAVAQINLVAANQIKADLDLRQTTALEDFTASITAVNMAGKAASDAAAALFVAASNQLVSASATAALAQKAAQDGMTYWGSVVTSTAAGIAASVQAMAAAAAAIGAAQASSSAAAAAATGSAQGAANEALVRGWYANNTQYQTNGHPPSDTEVAFWLNQLKSNDVASTKSAFALAAARDAGFSTPLDVSAFASGGDHMGGLRLVGENGPELEATGPSRIFNAGQTRDMLRGAGQDNAALITEIKALRQEVASLRTDTRAGDAANVSATKAQTRLLRDVTDNGTAVVTTPADA